MKEEFLRTGALIGESALEKLAHSAVAVFGIGGVGSYAAEALVRSGVGTLYIYDNDIIALSNINRQLVALHSDIGEYKTSAAKKRYLDINPDCSIIDCREFVTPESDIPFERFDYIIDAVDNVTAKLFLAKSAAERDIPIISVMGMGNKLDPTRIKVSDIYKTSVCPLARVMRYELKKRGVRKLLTVWSDEPPKICSGDGERPQNRKSVPASMAPVPGAAGLAAAAEVIKKLTE